MTRNKAKRIYSLFDQYRKNLINLKTNNISLGIEDTRELAKSHNIGFVSKSKEIINRSNTNELIDTTSHAK